MTGYRCIRCKQYQHEPAGEGCGNPVWHAAQPKQPGACWRCKCSDLDIDACGCCHVEPCEMER